MPISAALAEAVGINFSLVQETGFRGGEANIMGTAPWRAHARTPEPIHVHWQNADAFTGARNEGNNRGASLHIKRCVPYVRTDQAPVNMDPVILRSKSPQNGIRRGTFCISLNTCVLHSSVRTAIHVYIFILNPNWDDWVAAFYIREHTRHYCNINYQNELCL